MRRIHEIALAVGIAMLWAVLSRHVVLPPTPYFYFVLVAIPFALSAGLALTLTLHPRQKPLAARTAISYLLSVAGLSFLISAGVNDLWIPLSYPPAIPSANLADMRSVCSAVGCH